MRRVVLVTGAGRGIGRAIAQDFAADHDLALGWRHSAPQGFGAGALSLQEDLADPEAPARMVAAVLARFGRLDVIVNNAGDFTSSPVETPVGAEGLRLWQVNLLAAQGLLAAALPALEPGAAIVSISSVNAVLPPRGGALYGASKAALNLWTRGMAKELGPRGIRVNAVAPGAVENPETPRSAELRRAFEAETALGQLARPADIAAAVRFLSSPAAAAITGEVLTVSGGYRL